MNNNSIIIEPPETATSTIIWLHGLGASGHDFEPIVPQISSRITCHTRFIFPHAPHRPITINGGVVMPAWYDILSIDLPAQQDAQGIYDSEQMLCEYITQEIERGIDTQRIVLAGFSQGGVIALHTGLRYPLKLAGIMALSSYLPLAETLDKERHEANNHTSIFMAHGDSDPVISLKRAERSHSALKTLDYQVEWQTYPMQHSVCPEEIADISQWLSLMLH